MTAHVDLRSVLERAKADGNTRNIQCKFFSVTLYKKGTMHIKFNNQALVDRFNIYCCQKKNWLPPNYGKAAYTDMEREAQTVVDSFHGNGTEGSGASAYGDMMKRRDYFLGEPTGQALAMLGT
jgi:hypothetical protein